MRDAKHAGIPSLSWAPSAEAADRRPVDQEASTPSWRMIVAKSNHTRSQTSRSSSNSYRETMRDMALAASRRYPCPLALLGAAEDHLNEDGIAVQVPAWLDVQIGEPGDQPLPQLQHRLGAVHLSRVAERGDVVVGLVEVATTASGSWRFSASMRAG